MNRCCWHVSVLLVAVSTVVLISVLGLGASAGGPAPDETVTAGRRPQIHPDFAEAAVPPNIAPLNFVVRESGSRYRVRIRSRHGRPIEVVSRSGTIAIPEKPWHELLDANRGGRLEFEVAVRPSGGARWQRFDAFGCPVAPEDIDGYVAYRRIHPVHSAWRDMGIYQRDLHGFKERVILTNEYFGGDCVNCHTFCNNRTETMLVSTRSSRRGVAAMIIRDGIAEKVAAKFGYSAWHPTGKMVVYQGSTVVMFQHAAGAEVRDVIDLDSYLACYDVDSRTVKTAPALSRKDRLETYPAWSPDGRYLYFCSAPLTWTRRDVVPEPYDQIKYDLIRIEYDVQKDTWGTPETILSAKDTGLSILEPRISPDGHWLLFCMCQYGCFPVYQQSSDLYLVDLQAAERTGRYEYRRLAVNSDESESWHSWSSNSRWIAFSSKKGNGTFTRTYLSYIDPNGVAHQPLLLPQKDPSHYDSCLWTYSVPELTVEPVRVAQENLGRVVRGTRGIKAQMPVTMATPKAGPEASDPYRSTRE